MRRYPEERRNEGDQMTTGEALAGLLLSSLTVGALLWGMKKISENARGAKISWGEFFSRDTFQSEEQQ